MRFRLKNKKKLILILTGINLLVVGVGSAYSSYEDMDDSNMSIGSIAKIVFNNQITNSLSLPTNGIIPGSSADYTFKVGNYSNGVRSDVNINYSISIESFHFIPTTVKLYSVSSGTDTLLLTCNESTGTRNSENKLVCTSSTFTLLYSGNNEHNYKINIKFDSTDGGGNVWSSDYSDIIDYIDVKINSEQKTN